MALARYDDVGECWYPAQFYSRTMQKVRFYPGFKNEKGEIEEVESGPLVELWNRLQDPGGGRTDLSGSYGHLMFLIGDGYLVEGDEDGVPIAEYLSPLELRIQPQAAGAQEYLRLRAPGMTPEELVEASDDDFAPLGNEVRVSRLFRRHPSFSSWADSPVKAVLDLYALLRMLTLAGNAEAQSRAANRGLLYIPDELTFGPADAQDGQEDPLVDPVMQELIDAANAAIRDPGSASAMVPILLRGPGLLPTGAGTSVPMADLLKWMQLGPEDSYRAIDAWEKVIARIGNGLDLPGTIVTGEARNHWGDWLVDEQGFRQHVAPVCEKFGGDLTSAYLRPAARAALIENWENVGIGYDPAEAVNHPDQVATAKDMHDRLVISDETYREAGGYGEQDAPDDEELERRTLVKINVDPYAEPDAEVEGETAPQDGGSGNDATEAIPETQPATNGGVTASALAVSRILGASEAHISRIRALAGSRLKNRSQGCPDCQEKIRGLTASAIPPALGAEIVRGIIDGHATESDLVAGGGDELAETLRRWGVRGEWPAELGRLVEQHTQRTLYEADPPPLPSGFSHAVTKAIAA